MDIKADIVPAKSLGGFSLKKRISEYSKLLERYNIIGKLAYEQVGIYSTKYSFGSFPVEVYVDTRTGRIYKISAVAGYEGKLNKSVGIGMSANCILSLDYGFYYDECEEALLSKKLEGIAIELDEDDPFPEEVAGLNVEAITVFDPDTFKPWINKKKINTQ